MSTADSKMEQTNKRFASYWRSLTELCFGGDAYLAPNMYECMVRLTGRLTNVGSKGERADYEAVLSDHSRMVRELDVLLNGEAGAAKQASLCDIVSQVRRTGTRISAPAPSASPAVLTKDEIYEAMVNHCESNGYGVEPEVVESLSRLVSIMAAGAAPQPSTNTEELVRFCPDCGLMGDVPKGYTACCPDASHARIVPKKFAKICRETFRLLVDWVDANLVDNLAAPAPIASPDMRAVTDEREAVVTAERAIRENPGTTLSIIRRLQSELDAAGATAPSASPAASLNEPTPEMYEAAQQIRIDIGGGDPPTPLNSSEIRRLWLAMVSASPAAPQPSAKALTLPDRHVARRGAFEGEHGYANGWNACLDAVKTLAAEQPSKEGT